MLPRVRPAPSPLVSVVAAVLLVLAAVGAAALPGRADATTLPTPTPTVTLTGPASVVVGTPAVLTVTVTAPTAPGQTVTLERFGGPLWGSAGTAVLDSGSRATFTVTPTWVTTTKYRARIAFTRTHQAATSATYSLVSVAVPPPPPPAPDCGGEAPLKANGTAWVCTYADEFNGTSLDRDFWVPQVTATSNFMTGTATSPACVMDRPDTISEHDGVLELSAVVLPAPISCGNGVSSRKISGMVSHYRTFSQTYGRFEVRAKLPPLRGKGLQETFWLWPDNPTRYGAHPGSGEIDFAEFYSVHPDHVIPYLHYYNGPVDASQNQNVVTAYTCTIDYDRFNTYGLEWVPGQLRILVNGSVCLTDNYTATNATETHPYAPFDSPFFLALTQAFGTTGNEFDLATGPTLSSTKVDYVRIWR